MDSLNPYLVPLLDEIDRFLNDFPLTNEHQLIKHLQDNKVKPFDTFSLAELTDLFSAHFLCMHVLYHLKREYSDKQTFVLDIQLVRIHRIPLDESDELNNNEKMAIETIDPLESYYLNSKHYFETQEDEINDLLKSFWQKYMAQDEKKEALDVLNLPIDADEKMIKTQYKHLAQKHHPDKGGCAEMFTKIRQAKTVLDQLL
jgi:DnaJ-domain-containing protein 1